MKRLFVLLTILILAVGVAACGGDSATTSAEDGAGGSAAPETAAAETASEDSGGESGWVEVMSMTGSTSKRSPAFTLEGGEQKLEYTIEGDTMPMIAVYVEKDGWDIEKEGGFPVVWPDEAGSDSSMMQKDAGEYICQVESANCDWTVKILEKR